MAAGGSNSNNIHGASSDTKTMNGISMDDEGDNRTRNAKAQRRHREKRKAHLKSLEEQVQLITSQLEDARRQIGYANYGHRLPQGPLSPGTKSIADLQAENAYLRDENADLRRQLYRYAGTFGHVEDVKPDGYNPYGQPIASPREGSSRDGQAAPKSTGQYPPPNPSDSGDRFSAGSRSRVMSASSQQPPNASPYLASATAFPNDSRNVQNQQNQQQQQQQQQQQLRMDRYPPLQYDAHMYTSSPSGHQHSPGGGPAQPPPHSLPRSGNMPYNVDMYATGQGRPEGDAAWGAEQGGPPPFQGSVYPVTYGDGPAGDEWRPQQEDRM